MTIVASRTGTPSVMQTTRGTPASADSSIASAANAGGTKMSATFAPVSSTARLTELKTGTVPMKVSPPLPGVTPATRSVPYARQRSA